MEWAMNMLSIIYLIIISVLNFKLLKCLLFVLNDFSKKKKIITDERTYIHVSSKVENIMRSALNVI